MASTVNGYTTSAIYNVSPFWSAGKLLESEHSTGTGLASPVVETADAGNGNIDPTTLLNAGPSGRRAVDLSSPGGGSIAASMADMATFEPGYAQQGVNYTVNSAYSYGPDTIAVSANVSAVDPAAGVPSGLIRGTGGGHEANVGAGDVDVVLAGVTASSASMTLTLQGGMTVAPMIPADPTQAGTSSAETDVTAIVNGQTLQGTVTLAAGGGRNNNAATVLGTGVFAAMTGSSVGSLILNLTGLMVGSPNNIELHVHTSAEVDHTIAPTGSGAASAQYTIPLNFKPAPVFTTGNDNVNFNSPTQDQLTAIQTPGTDLYNALGGDDTVNLPYDAIASKIGYDKNHPFDAGPGNDTVTAWDGTNIIYGGLGSDTLTGGSGANFLYAGQAPQSANAYSTPDDSDNVLIGGSGTNFLDAWTGRTSAHDVLKGGSGPNTFLVQGNDEIQTFNAGDKIYLLTNGNADQANILANPQTGTTLITVFDQSASPPKVAHVTINAVVKPSDLTVKTNTFGGSSLVEIDYTPDLAAHQAQLTQDYINDANNTIALVRPVATALLSWLAIGKFSSGLVSAANQQFVNYLLPYFSQYSPGAASALQTVLAYPALNTLMQQYVSKIVGDAVKNALFEQSPTATANSGNAYTDMAAFVLKFAQATKLLPPTSVGGVLLSLGPAVIQTWFEYANQQLDAATKANFKLLPDGKTYYFQNADAGTTYVPPAASTTPSSETFSNVQITNTPQPDANGSSTVHYSYDPSGSSTYTFTSDAASPSLATVTLPNISDVASYNIATTSTGTSWGTPQNIAPGQTVQLPAGTKNIQIVSLDASGHPVASSDPIMLDVTYATSGTFNGSLQAVPTGQTITGTGPHAIATLNGTESNFTIKYAGKGTATVIDGAGNVVTSINNEVLQFSDQPYFIENGDGANIARLYSAGLGRIPDTGGLFNWEDIYTKNVSAAAKAQGVYVALAETSGGYFNNLSIADGIIDSPEFQAKYGALSNANFVTQLYQNVLGRAPEATGLNSWLTWMSTGDATGQVYNRGMVLVGFAESPENIAKASSWMTDMSKAG